MLRDGKLIELVNPRSYGRLSNPFLAVVPEEHRVPLISLGTAEDLEPEIIESKVRRGDWIILNTDGIENDIFKEIALIQGKKLNSEEASAAVQNLLNQKSYQDNASLALVII
jgi:serine/threonine protein phosphatase PrpC